MSEFLAWAAALILSVFGVDLTGRETAWLEDQISTQLAPRVELAQAATQSAEVMIATSATEINWLASSSASTSDWELVTVAKVTDGDTITLEDGRKVRYIGIDTPETKHPTKDVQCFGQSASQRNTELVMDQEIWLEKDISETDRYGRLLRYVWLNGVLINQLLLAEGFAQMSTYPPDVKYQAAFSETEKAAREQQLGLWNPFNCQTDTN